MHKVIDNILRNIVDNHQIKNGVIPHQFFRKLFEKAVDCFNYNSNQLQKHFENE